MDWSAAAPLISVKGAVWPGIQPLTQGDSASAGPTRTPWLDSNGWFLKLARSRLGKTAFWLECEPPANKGPVRVDAYLLAVLDAAAYGGRWVVSLDPALAGGIASKEQQALETWRSIAGALDFTRRHAAWETFRPLGVLGVISSFAGENEMLGSEILNLMARRQLAYQIVDQPQPGLNGIVAMDAGEPPRALREKLLAFASAGGLLIVSARWKVEGAEVEPHPRFRVLGYGKGRVAVSTEESPDPYVIAADAHILLSHSNDLFRLHNPGSLSCYYCGSADAKSDVLHLVNYSGRRSGSDITVWIRKRYRTARLWTLDQETAEVPPAHEEGRGFEYYMPPFTGYAALEFEA